MSTESRYTAQQPLALLNRIVKTNSNPGDIVLDPFCGSGTTLVAAQNNKRRWIGCDNLEEACALTRRRLEAHSGILPNVDFQLGDQAFIEDNFAVLYRPNRRLVTGFRDYSTTFIRNQPVHLEEGRYCEFKEIKGRRPIGTIKNAADEYAVAYLNDGRSGRVYWGIRDSDRVVTGVHLDSRHRDLLKRTVLNKLSTIIPPIDPGAYRITLHEVYEGGASVPDLYVVELRVPVRMTPGIYSTSSGVVFQKTDSGKKELNDREIADLIVRQQAGEVLDGFE